MISGLKQDDEAIQNEVFGPVISIIEVEDFEEAQGRGISGTPTFVINGEVLVADGGQWLNKGVFTLPEPGRRYTKV